MQLDEIGHCECKPAYLPSDVLDVSVHIKLDVSFSLEEPRHFSQIHVGHALSPLCWRRGQDIDGT